MIKISIITTVFNAAGTIRDCLDSVKGQTHEAIEHIVVDAASTDGTLDILSGSGFKVQGSGEELREFRVVSEPDSGIYDGMNKGLRLATGDVVGILNGDDMYYCPDVLAWVARVFEDDRVDSCYGDLVYIAGGDDGLRPTVHGLREKEKGLRFKVHGSREKDFKVLRYWKSGKFDARKFYWGWMPPHPTFFVRRSVYEKYGYFNLELGTAADYELMLRFLVKHRVSSAYLSEIIVKMRSGGASNVTLKSRLRANRMDRKGWEVNGLMPYPWTLTLKPLRKISQWFSRPER